MPYVAWLAAISLAFVVAERLGPRRPDAGLVRRGLGTDLVYVVFNGHFLGVALAAAYAPLVAALHRVLGAARVDGLVHAAIARRWPIALQLAVALVVVDLARWAIHRLFHRVPALWRLHQVHHSIEVMDWLGSLRFHVGEAVLYDALLYVPLAVLGFDGRVLFAHAVVGTVIGHFNHANLRLSIGPLRYLLNSPEMHVWHHAHPDAGPTDRNFGINLAVWDWLFGTAWLPPDGKAPARLGFDGIERYPRGPIGQLVAPVAWRPPVEPAGKEGERSVAA